MIGVELTRRRLARGGRVAAGGLFVLMASHGVAHGASLDAKAGLWERTVTTVTELAPSGGQQDLSKLDPESRAKLEQVMSGRITAGRHTRVTQECVTPAMLEKWSALARDEAGKSKCERAIATENSKYIKVALSCDGGKTTGDMEFTASGERLNGKIAMVSHEAQFDRLMTQQITSKWLGRDCGTVEPLKAGHQDTVKTK